VSDTYSPEEIRLEMHTPYGVRDGEYRLLDEGGVEFGRITLSEIERGEIKGRTGRDKVVYIGWVDTRKYHLTPKNWRDIFAAIAEKFPGTSEACGRRVSGWHKHAPKTVCYKLRRRA